MFKYNSRHCVIQTRWFDLPMFGVAEAATVAALDAFADKDGWCWPSQATIGEMLKKSPAWVRNAIAALEGMGIIEKQVRYDAGGNLLTCKYRVIHDAHRGDTANDTGQPATNPGQPVAHPGQPATINKTIEHITSKEVIRHSKATRLDPAWEPPFELLEWASREYPTVDARTATDSFRDYWTAIAGARGLKADWNATWRNWIRNQVNYGKRTGASNSNRPSGPIEARDNLERLAEAAASYRRANAAH